MNRRKFLGIAGGAILAAGGVYYLLAAAHFGYTCQWTFLASSNQDENVAEVKLSKSNIITPYDVSAIKNRRTLRSGYLDYELSKEDVAYLIREEADYFQYIPNRARELGSNATGMLRLFISIFSRLILGCLHQ